jgi:hypothetical protein
MDLLLKECEDLVDKEIGEIYKLENTTPISSSIIKTYYHILKFPIKKAGAFSYQTIGAGEFIVLIGKENISSNNSVAWEHWNQQRDFTPLSNTCLYFTNNFLKTQSFNYRETSKSINTFLINKQELLGYSFLHFDDNFESKQTIWMSVFDVITFFDLIDSNWMANSDSFISRLSIRGLL